ncbi:DUF4179 domain-containing protein [uncultured Clostridium sp.]|uniref:DUF4179 domain-containing protein n=1 Tax=uncultured Clostridium sp. TaxID=59620 RepID=UPI002607060E|nr:DUF4179 domain-containing protein [uncultured Clostridium sp.]
MDKLDKEILKKDNTKLPNSFNKRVDEVLENLEKDEPKQSKYKKIFRNIAIAAGITICVGIGGINAVAVEKGITVKEVINRMLGFNKDEEKYKIEVLNVIENKNVKVTVKEAIYDGYTVKFTYKIESEKEDIKKLKENLEFECRRLDSKSSNGHQENRSQVIDDTTIEGVYSWKLKLLEYENSEELVPLENLDLEFKVWDEKREFKFKMNVKDIKTKNETKTYNVNRKIENGIIENIVVTPMNIRVYGQGDEKLLNNLPMYILEDNTGIKDVWHVGGGTSDGKNADMQYEYKNNFKDLSKIKLYKMGENIERKGTIKIDGSGEVKHSKLDKEEEFEILRIEDKDDISIIYYKAKNPLLISFEIGDEYGAFDQSLIEKNIATATFKKIKRDKKYKLKYYRNTVIENEYLEFKLDK